MQKQKGVSTLTGIIIIVVVVVVAFGGVFAYQYFATKIAHCVGEGGTVNGSLPPKYATFCCPGLVAQTPKIPGADGICVKTAVQNKTGQTADWKTYTNSEYGFEFKYPAGFFYWEPKALIGDCNYIVFPAQCPNINDIVANEQIAEGGDAAAVRSNISFFPKGDKTTINNSDYCLYKTGDPAAGSVYYDYYYATVKNQKCFIMRLVTRLTNCGVFGTTGDKAYDDCIVYNATTYPQKLNQIISTFKFTK